uniref:Uncharacterized protein n=1 Tax=Salix viminalis TaxID=40686 RepID=A0A6N2M600_SALVM
MFSDDMERDSARIPTPFLLYIKTFSSCMIPSDPSSILYQNAFHEKLRIFPLTSFKWSVFTEAEFATTYDVETVEC